jgi:hypothetical protein
MEKISEKIQKSPKNRKMKEKLLKNIKKLKNAKISEKI